MFLNFIDFINKDFVYQQNPDGTYIFDSNGAFLLQNRNDITDTILDSLHRIYIGIIQAKRIDPGEIRCNVPLLDQVLTRYSRDIFGELRLDAKINKLHTEGRITENQKILLSEYSDYGFKIDSRSPYLHRKLANLLYWFSVLKPFSIYTKDNITIKSLGVVFEFHNEFITYLLMLAILKIFNKTLSIHHEKDRFYDFLYDLHYRKISRSSLEFFLNSYVHPIK